MPSTSSADIEELLAVKVLVLLEMNGRVTPRHKFIFMVAANFPEELLVLGDVAELVQGLAGRGVRGGVWFAIDVDADRVGGSRHWARGFTSRRLIRFVCDGLVRHSLGILSFEPRICFNFNCLFCKTFRI
jgi:hypothetical protein